MLTVNVTVPGLTQAIAYMTGVQNRLLGDQARGLYRVVNRIGDVWLDNFKTEGGRVGGWEELAETTRQRRASQGFSPEHPILQRSGALRGAAIDAFTSARGNKTVTRNDGYSDSPVTSTLQVQNGVARLNARGWKVLNQEDRGGHAPRPFWFVDRTVMFAAQSGLTDWLVNDVLTP